MATAATCCGAALAFVSAIVRPNGVLVATCSLMTAALRPFVAAKSRIAGFEKDDRTSTAANDPAAVEPSFPALAPCVLTQFANRRLTHDINTGTEILCFVRP
jgi:hypothetical protein